MNVDAYLDALDTKLREISAFVTASTIHREMDANTDAPFHRHTSTGVQAHGPVTTLDALAEIVKMLKL